MNSQDSFSEYEVTALEQVTFFNLCEGIKAIKGFNFVGIYIEKCFFIIEEYI